MKLLSIPEPYLQFGTGEHVCPRVGIIRHGVFDANMPVRRDRMYIGAVGISSNLARLGQWIARAKNVIPGKASSLQANLFPPFPGFCSESGFKAKIIYEQELTRVLKLSDIRRIGNIAEWDERIDYSVGLYAEEIRFLAQNRNVDVIVCVIPEQVFGWIGHELKTAVEDDLNTTSPARQVEKNFRRLLKAVTMQYAKPIQLLRELSLEADVPTQQDDATKAWNFFTALYYKTGQTIPWRLKQFLDQPTCYVGISFYRSRDRLTLNSSLAQLFDELGHGIILRGTPVDIDKRDRRPYLTEEQIYEIVTRAISEYRSALRINPARLVIHKTSKYRPSEIEGLQSVQRETGIDSMDMVSINIPRTRLFRAGEYPPFRGTAVHISPDRQLLYTRGSVPFYKTYPGSYVPQPLEISAVQADQPIEFLARETLSLTKMNWNDTRFDGKYPITIHCAREVGAIMKYLPAEQVPQISYRFYM